jgi:hypothetical protein
MAKYTITHSCGHQSTFELFGPSKQREWRLQQEEQRLCYDCYQKERAKQTAELAEKNREIGLPPLKGTEKQVQWAECIRAEAVVNMERHEPILSERDKAKFRKALDIIYSKDSAAWWIDNRDWVNSPYMDSFFRFLTRVLEEAAREEQDNTPEAIAAKAEATIRPAEAKSEIVAEIAIDGGTISVHYPEKDDDLRAIVKGLKYRWIDRAWRRTFTAKQGPVVDRAAEVAHHLLAAGFVVQILNPEAREKAVSGEYTPEQTRWISARDDRFIFTWGKDEDYYQVARRIPGSRYESPHVTVPSVQFEQVLDFADRYSFSLDASAQRLAEKAKAEKEAALIVEVEAPRKEKGLAPSTKPPELEVPEEVSVDESLLDDD